MKGFLYVNVLRFPMSPRKIPFKRQFLPSRVTRISRLLLGKMQNYVFPSGIVGCVKPFSCTALNAIKKWGTFKAHAEAHALYVEHYKLVKQAKAALAELDKTTIEGPRRLLRRPKKKRLWLMHLMPNCVQSTRRTLRRPKKPQRLPRARRNPLQRRCSSYTQTCCLQMLSTQDGQGADGGCSLQGPTRHVQERLKETFMQVI